MQKIRDYKPSWQSKELVRPPGIRGERVPYAGARLCVDNQKDKIDIYLRWCSRTHHVPISVLLRAYIRDDKMQDIVLLEPATPLYWHFQDVAARLVMISRFVSTNIRPRSDELRLFILSAERLGFEVRHTYTQFDDDAWQDMREQWLEGHYIPKKVKRKLREKKAKL